MPAIFHSRLKRREVAGILLVGLGEVLILVNAPAVSDFYFPITWLGYSLALDGFRSRIGRSSLFDSSSWLFLLMFPVSAGFWWLFEAFNLPVGNWSYVGGGAFAGWGFVALASLSFSTVLPAVWETAMCVYDAIAVAAGWLSSAQEGTDSGPLPWYEETQSGGEMGEKRRILGVDVDLRSVMVTAMLFGLLSIILPILLPRYAFGLVWASLFFLLDPTNFWLGRPSLIAQAWSGRFQTVAAFASGGLMCGFFWESWNYWATVKWVYNVPFVSQWHLFEMPVPGYSGYLPFGLEVFALTVFVLTPCAALVRVVGRAFGEGFSRRSVGRVSSHQRGDVPAGE